jgi:predicted Zn-dependent protease
MYSNRSLSLGGGSMVRFIIGGIIALMSVVGYYASSSKNEVTGEKQHVALTADQEIALGQKAIPELEQQYGPMETDQKAEAVVDNIGAKLINSTAAGKTPYKFDFHVLNDNNTINAFALPGGQVFITSGLLSKLQTEGQVAGVLGHEVGHVVARHSAQQLAKQKLTSGIAGAATIATYDPNNPNSQYSGAIAQAIGQLVNMKFGRNDELQADNLGVRFMAETGYDPRAMIGVMEILDKETKRGNTPEFFSTHPNPQNRITKIKEAIAKNFPNGLPAGLEK